MSSYSFSDAAVQDLNEICNYIAQSNPNAASQLFDAIRQKCVVVASFPNMGKNYFRLAPGLRGFVVDDYIVFLLPKRRWNRCSSCGEWISKFGIAIPEFGR